jgi:glutamine amidotransferase
MIPPEITIIDYGVGNILSVQRAFEFCGAKVVSTSDPRIILESQKVVLPGVGAFPKAMEKLRKLELDSVIKELTRGDTHILAICLGMQLLMEESSEFELTSGLGLIAGDVIAIPNETNSKILLKVPHIGWNSLEPNNIVSNWEGTILHDISPQEEMYFLHSFMANPFNSGNVLAHTVYGDLKIPAVVQRDMIFGCQFHPEKSGAAGLRILRKFLAL